jgi:RND family efflux transporter MFP subunit
MSLLRILGIVALVGLPVAAQSATFVLKASTVTEWKAVYGTVEARDSVLARARIGGTISSLSVTEGDLVKADAVLATVIDEKIDFQIKAVDAQLLGLTASIKNAETELDRAERLIQSGATTAQRLDTLKTQVDVLRNQIAAAEAQRSIAVEQSKEGSVLAPGAGRVLTVPVTRNAVVMAGEVIATIGGGGIFLRLSVPERHAGFMQEGIKIRISANGVESTGKLAKIYPQIENGRVIADVEVAELKTDFINARVLVELPVGTRKTLLVPATAVFTRNGLDFVTVSENGQDIERTVITGEAVDLSGIPNIEILTGLKEGDTIAIP